MPLMEILNRASAGERTQPTRQVGPEKTHGTIVEVDGTLRVQSYAHIADSAVCRVGSRLER